MVTTALSPYRIVISDLKQLFKQLISLSPRTPDLFWFFEIQSYIIFSSTIAAKRLKIIYVDRELYEIPRNKNQSL